LTKPADLPFPVSAKDRHLVEWVAGASVGDRIPAPWCYASSPLESMVRTLATLGVVPQISQGSDWAAIARGAAPAARAWLQQHPARGAP
jgi:hypothetical protein